MAKLKITGPDGRTGTLNIPDGATPEQIQEQATWVQRNWDALAGGKSTAPELAPDVRKGPLRPTAEGVASLPVEDQRSLREAMTPEESAKTRSALAQAEAARIKKAGLGASPIGFGVSGAIAPNLIDKAAAGVEAGLYALGLGGQPYDEAVETKRLQREQNWQENPIETFAGGTAAALSLPAVRAGNPATRGGWVGGAAATGGLYGGLQGAGEGEGLGEGFAGFLKGAGLGTVTGAAMGRLTQGLRPQSAEELGAIADAQKAQVRANNAIVSPDFEQQQKAGLLSKMPYVGEKLQEGLNTAVGDVAEGVRRVARGYSAMGPSATRVANPDLTSEVEAGLTAVDRVRNRIKKLDPAEVEKGFQGLKAQIAPDARSSLDRTRQLAQTLTADDIEAATRINQPAVNAVLEAVTRPDGLTYDGLLRLRQAVGALQKEDVVTKGGTSEPAFRRLYGALSEDMKDLVKGAGGPQALSEFNKLMAETQKSILRRKGLEKIVGKAADVSPEKLVDDVMRWAGNGPQRNVRNLLLLKQTIGDDAMSDIAAATLQRGLMSARNKGEVSIAEFGKFWKGLTPNGQRFLFGQNPALVDELNALSRTTDNIQKVLGETNNSRTSYGNYLMRVIDGTASSVNKVGMTVGGGLIGGGTLGAAVSDLATTGGLAAAAVGTPIAIGRLMARDLNKPATVRSLNRVYQALSNYVQAKDGRASAQAVVGLRLALEGLADLAAESSGEPKEKVRADLLQAARLNEVAAQGGQP